MEQIYDVAVLGGGPGGYTAALYCARAGLSTVVLEKLSPGGQMATTSNVENYPGFAEGVDGFDLAMQMKDGAERFGVETLFADATAVALEGGVKTITTSSGERRARTVILATGADPRPLGVPHEDELRGRGVAYCATCDGMLYRGKTVVVVGGGNSAAEDALFLSRVCKKVYLVHRGAVLTASKSYWTALQKAENVEFIWNSRVVELLYGSVVTGVVLEGVESGNRSELACDGVFIAVGRIPNTGLFHGVHEAPAPDHHSGGGRRCGLQICRSLSGRTGGLKKTKTGAATKSGRACFGFGGRPTGRTGPPGRRRRLRPSFLQRPKRFAEHPLRRSIWRRRR